MNKTNAMRMLDSAKIKYEVFLYEYDENDLSGVHAAEFLKIKPSEFYKTLVLKGERNGYFVCCIPVDKEVDLKKAAGVMKDKSVDMLHVQDLQGITGYIRGGCSPIGMKKKFPTFFDRDVEKLEKVFVSGGMRGCAIKVNSKELREYIKGCTADITR